MFSSARTGKCQSEKMRSLYFADKIQAIGAARGYLVAKAFTKDARARGD